MEVDDLGCGFGAEGCEEGEDVEVEGAVDVVAGDGVGGAGIKDGEEGVGG